VAKHEHKFQREGTTWACWGHDDQCGYRAPACFSPVWEALTRKGQIDSILEETAGDPWRLILAGEHAAIIIAGN